MKKRIIGGVVIFAVALAVVTVAANGIVKKIKAELRPDFIIEIDDKIRTFKNAQGEEVHPILYEGTTYLPVRAIGELMGKEVYWYEKDKRIELVDKNKTTVTDADVIKVDEKEKADKQYKEKDAEDVGIGKEKAKEIALEKADLKENDVNFVKIELEKDDGVLVYDIEFVKDYIEYSAEIKADDGKILDWDIDRED